ncbi:MAG: Hsp20/alpha crystallin family protein [Alphaproteobacteria bacterium]
MAEKKMEVKKAAKSEEGGLPATRALTGYFQSLHDQIDRMFEDFTGGFPFSVPMPRLGRGLFDIDPFRGVEKALAPLGMVHPSVDIAESDKELKVTAELPGMTDKDVEVVLSDDMLTIKGEKRVEKEDKDKNYYLMERSYGAFQRSFRLPESVDKGKIEARFDNGILTVRAPKMAKAAAKETHKKIQIKSK